jgi:glycosyl transferase family 2
VKIVQTLIVRDEAEVLDAHIAYHLNAGVDLVIATHHGSRPETSEILDSYKRASYLRLFREKGEARQAEWRTSMARLAATEYEADWVINSDPVEFWWPRGESLKEVLAPIPLRYTIVQGLRRPFVAESGGDDFFSERMTHRRPLQSDSRDRPESPAAFLRPVHRADPNVVVGADGAIGMSPLVPLRAWYPIEVLEFPIHDGEHVDRTVLDGAVVTDTRLRDALRVLRDRAGSNSRPGAFALPRQEERVLSFRTPDVVDDAAYAVECAAVGEVDLPRLEAYITELEQRVNWLEQRFWPRVLRLASRLVRRVAR